MGCLKIAYFIEYKKMPKDPEKQEVRDTNKKASPYRRGDAPCTLFLRKKILFRKNDDGTLNRQIHTISNKWMDGTFTCKCGTERPDIWVVKAEVEKGIENLRDCKLIKYMLCSMKDKCKCRGYHTWQAYVVRPNPAPHIKVALDLLLARQASQGGQLPPASGHSVTVTKSPSSAPSTQLQSHPRGRRRRRGPKKGASLQVHSVRKPNFPPGAMAAERA